MSGVVPENVPTRERKGMMMVSVSTAHDDRILPAFLSDPTTVIYMSVDACTESIEHQCNSFVLLLMCVFHGSNQLVFFDQWSLLTVCSTY